MKEDLKDTPAADEYRTPPPERYNVFWPILIFIVGLLVILTWNLVMAAQQRLDASRALDQQLAAQTQAAQAESKLKLMMMDLLTLAKQDPQAQAIVEKYGVRYNPPAAGESASASEPESRRPSRPPRDRKPAPDKEPAPEEKAPAATTPDKPADSAGPE